MTDTKYGITKSGKKTEALLVELVPKLRKNEGAAKKGDVIFENTNLSLDFFAEVKKNAWNQVRPMKYIPVIGHVEETGEWYVVPADILMEWSSTRMGQHTPNPFVCIGLGTPRSETKKGAKTKWAPYLVAEKDLESKIIYAYKSATSNRKMRDFAANIRIDIDAMSKKHKRQAGEILHD